MAEKDFVVKNGLHVSGDTWVINSTAFFYNGSQFANSSHFSGQSNTALNANTANNSSYLGGVAAENYINTSATFTLSGSLNFGSGSTNTSINSTGFYVNGALLKGSGGYYKGNAGIVGDSSNKGNLYRINSNTQSANITISAGENALTAGPIVIDVGYNLTIDTGGRVVIV